MPAVELGRLQREAADLSEKLADPPAYIRSLERILETYASRVHKTGVLRGARPILFSYETSPIVLKQLLRELEMLARQDPDRGLLIADALWARRTIETRQLAIRLLGETPASKPGDLTRRLESWVAENREDFLASELWEQGTLTLCRQFPQELIRFAGNMTRSPDHRKQIFGFGALRVLLQNNPQPHLPAIFFTLANFREEPLRKLRPYIADLLSTLAKHSPKETAFFIQEKLKNSPSEGMRWITRQAMKRLADD